MPSLPLLWAVVLTAAAPGAPALSDPPLDRVAVKRQIRHELRACYAPFIRAHPRPPGTIKVSLTVTAAGTVTDAKAAGIDPPSDACWQSKAAGWHFANGAGGNTALQLSVPAAEIDPEAGPISLAEVQPLLPVPPQAKVLEPLDDDGLDQIRERLCWPGAVSETGADEAGSRLARTLEAQGWKPVVTPEAGEKATRRLKASQKGYQLGGRLTPGSPVSHCEGYEVSLSVRAPHSSPAH